MGVSMPRLDGRAREGVDGYWVPGGGLIPDAPREATLIAWVGDIGPWPFLPRELWNRPVASVGNVGWVTRTRDSDSGQRGGPACASLGVAGEGPHPGRRRDRGRPAAAAHGRGRRRHRAATDEIGAAVRWNRTTTNQREGKHDHETDDHHASLRRWSDAGKRRAG